MIVLLSLGLLVLAVLAGWLAGVGERAVPADAPPGPGRRRGWSLTSWLLALLASLLLVAAGGAVLAGSGDLVVSLPDALGSSGFRVDRLSALFLVITFAVAVPATVAGIAREQRARPRAGAAAALVLLACTIVITANSLFILYAGWEGIGVAFYLAVGYDRDLPGRPATAVLAAGFSKFSGAALLLGGLLAAQGRGFSLASLAAAPSGGARDAGYALLLLAFAVKVGLVPVHLWLPRAYASAPPLLRAVLAGVAVNVGFYGMWRTLLLLGAPPVWLTCTVLVLAGLTAVLGIAHATVNARLAQFVAWSSVENAGLILGGFGVALVGATVHNRDLIAVGLLAGTAQVCAHALGKTLLFTAAAAAEEAYCSDDLDLLRGLARRLPAAGIGLLVGSVTLAGIPLTAGFASEWLLVESMMQEFRVHLLPVNLTLAVAGALTALTIGTAGIAFVRLVALTVFGPPSALPGSRGRPIERSRTYRTAVGLLTGACLGVAAVAPLELGFIGQGLEPITGRGVFAAANGWILQPVFAGFSALSPTWLWIVLPAYVLLLAVGTVLLSRGRLMRVRRVAPWQSASPGVQRGHGYTSFAFANPLRKVLAAVLLTRNELRHEGGAPPEDAQDGATTAGAMRLGYTVDVVDIIEQYLYRPVLPAGRAIVRTAKRLQSGRLDAYLGYMLIAFIAVLAVVAALHTM